jgi:nicotinate-nucleotide pyrophosphorylase (carboxylating)
MLEKYAVTVGGGKNHRMGLDSMVLIKDNHIKAAGGIIPALRCVRERVSPFLRIEVETESLEQVEEALAAGADVIMLDNMPLPLIKQSVDLIGGKALVEVSGNVTLERVAELAASGVDFISSGALTHSVKAADISMRLR